MRYFGGLSGVMTFTSFPALRNTRHNPREEPMASPSGDKWQVMTTLRALLTSWRR